jgi:hypothetical protein
MESIEKPPDRIRTGAKESTQYTAKEVLAIYRDNNNFHSSDDTGNTIQGTSTVA